MARNKHYDVIIIGGRCAGATLALRLAGSDLKILLLDRATFPSLPSVPSSPFIHPAAIRLIAELGIDESEYAHPGARIERIVLDFVNYFHTMMPLARMKLDRNYCIGLDRNLFDQTLWNHAAGAKGVTAREGFAVTEILKDESGVVNGISGKAGDGPQERFTADLVVGADGRFSFSARQFGAKAIEERNEYTTAAYHAEWENVDPYAPEYPNAINMYNTNESFMLLVIPIGERKYIVSTYMPSQAASFGAQGLEQAYYEGLQRVPHLWNRLRDARRVTDITGVRPIENGYREAFGANWALVGDAVHYKDPLDGQGIYDALLESKLLAETILEWKRKGTAWTEAGARYQQRMVDATHPFFLQTAERVKQTVFVSVPGFVVRTLVRWTTNDPDYQTRFLRYLSRAIDPADYNVGPSISPRIIMNGIMADIRSRSKGG